MASHTLHLFLATIPWLPHLGLATSLPQYGAGYASPTTPGNDKSTCRCYPTDACWPSTAEWAAFNATVGGRLVATVPIASACHYDDFTPYDEQACAALRDVWGYPQTHVSSSSSPMAQFFTNGSCNPFAAPSDPCAVGPLVQYAVNASSASRGEAVADYKATLAFAAERNIRLVIRNTGHDYLGKSTGPGALALWTHHLKDIGVVDYSSSYYTGKALSLGAGVQVLEAYEAAAAAGLVVVGGNCETVGITGGYTQGGGLGILASSFGLSADNVLEWEVVTAGGEHVVARPGTGHEDLYWALSGGGGGTYAAVVSVTVRAHADMRFAGANLTVVRQQGTNASDDVFWDVVRTFVESAPRFADLSGYVSFALQEGSFVVIPAVVPNVSADVLQSLFDPTLAALDGSGLYSGMPDPPPPSPESPALHFVSHSHSMCVGLLANLLNRSPAFFIDDFPTYLDAYHAVVPVSNVTEYNIGGRLIPRSLVENNTTALVDTLKYIASEGAVISAVSANVSSYPLDVANSVNSVWRSSIYSIVIGLYVLTPPPPGPPFIGLAFRPHRDVRAPLHKPHPLSPARSRI